MTYPPAERLDVSDVLHGVTVADPYRWLEDPAAPPTRAWSEAQDRQCAAWLAGLTGRAALRARLTELVPSYVSPPLVMGVRRFWTERAPGQDHAVLLVADDAGERTLVDPNALSADGTVTLDGWSPSIEGDRLAYQLSEGGDEESRIRVLDVATGRTVDGPIDRTRYSPVAWLPGGDAYLYVRRLAPDQVPAGEAAYHRRVWLHRVGADPENDVLVFGEGVAPTAYLGVSVPDDGAWVAVTVSLGTAPRNDLHLARLAGADPAALDWRPVLVGADAAAWPHFDRRSRLWILTDLDAPCRRLCATDPADAAPGQWTTVVAEDADGAVLEDFALAGDALVVLHSRHAISELTVCDRSTGVARHAVALPGPGSAVLAGRPDEGAGLWIGYTDHVTPFAVLALDPLTASLAPDGTRSQGGQIPSETSDATPAAFAQRGTYRSADGTEVTITVVAPARQPDRPRPAILYGYGGFNVPMTPAYSSSILAWVDAGGVWAVANLRGGSEEGEAWHRDGMRQHKQHVFEDAEAAAAWLIAEGWTTTEQLAIMGGSNGGLLVGAAITRQPSTWAAAVCSAPLLDMVRYERFGLGATWNDEYGTADDPTELGWLLGYSPYHHVNEGVAYPAVLFTVFDGDTRVDPLHARKMAAALQWATSADPARHPILLRREADVGHGARSVRRTVDLAADQLAFLADQLGLDLRRS